MKCGGHQRLGRAGAGSPPRRSHSEGCGEILVSRCGERKKHTQTHVSAISLPAACPSSSCICCGTRACMYPLPLLARVPHCLSLFLPPEDGFTWDADLALAVRLGETLGLSSAQGRSSRPCKAARKAQASAKRKVVESPEVSHAAAEPLLLFRALSSDARLARAMHDSHQWSLQHGSEDIFFRRICGAFNAKGPIAVAQASPLAVPVSLGAK